MSYALVDQLVGVASLRNWIVVSSNLPEGTGGIAECGLRIAESFRNPSSLLNIDVRWRSPIGRGDWLKPSLMKVRILSPAPGKATRGPGDGETSDCVNLATSQCLPFTPSVPARVAKLVKAPVRKTGHREFESHRVLLMRRWSRNQARLAHNQQIIR